MTNSQRYKSYLRWQDMMDRRALRLTGKSKAQLHADKYFNIEVN